MRMTCQRIGRPPISTSGLGIDCVCSCRRVPRPPQRMTTFWIVAMRSRIMHARRTAASVRSAPHAAAVDVGRRAGLQRGAGHRRRPSRRCASGWTPPAGPTRSWWSTTPARTARPTSSGASRRDGHVRLLVNDDEPRQGLLRAPWDARDHRRAAPHVRRRLRAQPRVARADGRGQPRGPRRRGVARWRTARRWSATSPFGAGSSAGPSSR